MRKLLWGCAAAALVAVAAGAVTWDYACHHRDSWLGHGVVTAEKAAVTQVKTMDAGRRSAEVAFAGMKGLLTPRSEQPAPAEDVCPVAPAVLPGAVALHEDGAALAREPMPPVREFAGAAEECEAAMPAVPDDAARMPACDDDGCRPQPKGHDAPPAVMPPCHEESEPTVPNMDGDGGMKPAHPDVDTMEARPGDLHFLDFRVPF